MKKEFLLLLCCAFTNTVYGFDKNDFSHEIIVKYNTTSNFLVFTKNNSSPSIKFKNKLVNIQALSGETLKFSRNSLSGATVLSLNTSKHYSKLEDIASIIEQDFDVEYAIPNRRVFPLQMIPNDPEYKFDRQWSLKDQPFAISMTSAWHMHNEINGRNVVVAVIDSGYKPHPDLIKNIIPGYDFISAQSNSQLLPQLPRERVPGGLDLGSGVAKDECFVGSPARENSWHGTKVASIIAAETNNGKNMAGIAYNSKILPIRVLGKCGGNDVDTVDAIYWAAGKAVVGTSIPPIPQNKIIPKVINLSLGGTINNGLDAYPCPAYYQEAINYALQKNITIVVAAGNDGENSKATKAVQRANNTVPGNCNGVITVTGTGSRGNRVSSASHGSVVDVSAPGFGISTLSYTNIRNRLNTPIASRSGDGSSFAAPHVAGIAALLYGINANLNPVLVKKIITVSASPDFGTNSFEFNKYCTRDRLCGTGIVNAQNALSIPLLPIPIISNTPPNTAPDSVKVKGTEPTNISPLNNDSGVNGESLTAQLGTLPVNGKVVPNSDNATFTYTHDGSNNLTDNFTYTATNGIATSTPVIVNITIELDAGVGKPGIIEFTSSTSSVVESKGTITLTIVRSSGSSGSVTVGYSTVNKTAFAGTDFTNTAGTLSFADGVLNQTISIPITVDSITELTENFVVNLSNPSGGASLGTNNSATISISDDSFSPTGINELSIPIKISLDIF